MVKEGFGMPLDDLFFENAVNDFKTYFDDIFSEEMMLIDEVIKFSRRGYFKLVYKYLPLNYNIIIENDRVLFTIMIEDSEKATTFLSRFEEFDNSLNNKNIENALCILKKALDKNEFALYVYKDDKVYRKINNQLKRIKDIGELLNG
jgi:hypothetical protein